MYHNLYTFILIFTFNGTNFAIYDIFHINLISLLLKYFKINWLQRCILLTCVCVFMCMHSCVHMDMYVEANV